VTGPEDFAVARTKTEEEGGKGWANRKMTTGAAYFKKKGERIKREAWESMPTEEKTGTPTLS